MKKSITVAFAICVSIVTTSCNIPATSTSPTNTIPVAKIKVVASFYPLADFAKQVGGDYVEVTNIVPAGSEPHDYEPSPRDITKLFEAQLIIAHGAGMDP